MIREGSYYHKASFIIKKQSFKLLSLWNNAKIRKEGLVVWFSSIFAAVWHILVKAFFSLRWLNQCKPDKLSPCADAYLAFSARPSHMIDVFFLCLLCHPSFHSLHSCNSPTLLGSFCFLPDYICSLSDAIRIRGNLSFLSTVPPPPPLPRAGQPTRTPSPSSLARTLAPRPTGDNPDHSSCYRRPAGPWHPRASLCSCRRRVSGPSVAG